MSSPKTVAHNLFPGTAAKMTVRTATITTVRAVTQIARPINNLRTYGSLMRMVLNGVWEDPK
jgi:hypothetical protein